MILRAVCVELPFNNSVLDPINSAIDSIQAITDPNRVYALIVLPLSVS